MGFLDEIADFADEDDVLEAGKGCPDLRDLALVEHGRGDEDLAATDGHALVDGFGAERGEERAEDAAVLERADCCDVELGDAFREGEDGVAGADFEVTEHVRERIARQFEILVGEVAALALAAQPADSYAVAAAGGDVPVDGEVGDVDVARRIAEEFAAGVIPSERRNCRGVVAQVWSDTQGPGGLPDRRPVHRALGHASSTILQRVRGDSVPEPGRQPYGRPS